MLIDFALTFFKTVSGNKDHMNVFTRDIGNCTTFFKIHAFGDILQLGASMKNKSMEENNVVLI